MLIDIFTGIGLYFGFIAAIGLPLVLLKARFNLPFEVLNLTVPEGCYNPELNREPDCRRIRIPFICR